MSNLPNDSASLRSLVLQLLKRVEVLESENEQLRLENSRLKKENTDLHTRLKQNSNNSHKPPSLDGYKKKPAIPKQKGKKTGGQKGHKGHTLQMVAVPDKVIVHHASHCSCCKKELQADQVSQITTKRQVFDIPEPKLEVVEHRIGLIHCCGQAHQGSFPSHVSAPVQYGNKIKAMVSLMNSEYRLPLEKIGQLFDDLYGHPINESSIVSANAKLYETLQEPEQRIKEALLSQQLLHVDETGLRVTGKLHWLHTVCNKAYCYLFVHEKRGKQALYSAGSLLPDYTGCALHDCWKSYFEFENCEHALCNAHILRELNALMEQGSIWAADMHQLLLLLYSATDSGKGKVDNFTEWQLRYGAICDQADKQEPRPIQSARGRPKNSKGRNLLNRLIKHGSSVLAFAQHEWIPFTNNLAEQAVRHAKVKQKVATCFRTFNGAQWYARIQGFIITTRKQGQNTFKQICQILDGKEYQLSTLMTD